MVGSSGVQRLGAGTPITLQQVRRREVLQGRGTAEEQRKHNERKMQRIKRYITMGQHLGQPFPKELGCTFHLMFEKYQLPNVLKPGHQRFQCPPQLCKIWDPN